MSFPRRQICEGSVMDSIRIQIKILSMKNVCSTLRDNLKMLKECCNTSSAQLHDMTLI